VVAIPELAPLDPARLDWTTSRKRISSMPVTSLACFMSVGYCTKPDTQLALFTSINVRTEINSSLHRRALTLTQIITTAVLIGPYDCRSVMHYYISSTDPKGFRTRAPGCCDPFHGVMLSLGDIRALQSLYWGCAWAFRRSEAKDIGVGMDCSVWATRVNSSIERWDGVNWHPVPGSAERISVSSASKAWVVNSSHGIFEWDDPSGSWIPRPGKATDIAAIIDGRAWAIATNTTPGGFGIQRWNGASWDSLPGGAVRISARSHDDAWVVNDQGAIFQWTPAASTTWTRQPGVALDIAIGKSVENQRNVVTGPPIRKIMPGYCSIG
jgi:hypothetical protein